MLEFIVNNLPRNERMVYARMVERAYEGKEDPAFDGISNMINDPYCRLEKRQISSSLKSLEERGLVSSYDSKSGSKRYKTKIAFGKKEHISIDAKDFPKYLACLDVAMKKGYFDEDSDRDKIRPKLTRKFGFNEEKLKEVFHAMNAFLLEETVYHLNTPLSVPE